jgi:hypothetical protein
MAASWTAPNLRRRIPRNTPRRKKWNTQSEPLKLAARSTHSGLREGKR